MKPKLKKKECIKIESRMVNYLEMKMEELWKHCLWVKIFECRNLKNKTFSPKLIEKEIKKIFF